MGDEESDGEEIDGYLRLGPPIHGEKSEEDDFPEIFLNQDDTCRKLWNVIVDNIGCQPTPPTPERKSGMTQMLCRGGSAPPDMDS
jgi:hypothetical protein